MEEFLRAVAETMRNLGVEAEARGACVRVAGIDCYAEQRRAAFRFLGRSYRTGNVLRACLDLIDELPRFKERQERAEAERRKRDAARALNASLEGSGFSVDYDGRAFRVAYLCDDFEQVRAVLAKLEKEVNAAAEAAWQEVLSTKYEGRIATFTSEGGFSLN